MPRSARAAAGRPHRLQLQDAARLAATGIVSRWALARHVLAGRSRRPIAQVRPAGRRARARSPPGRGATGAGDRQRGQPASPRATRIRSDGGCAAAPARGRSADPERRRRQSPFRNRN